MKEEVPLPSRCSDALPSVFSTLMVRPICSWMPPAPCAPR